MSVVPTDAQPCNEKLLSDLLNENTSDISPQSRNEAFLLGLINKVVPDITPVSRVECYLKALCEKNAGDDSIDHSKLKNRDAADQHPMSAITGLEQALKGKQPVGDYLMQDDLQGATNAALAQAKASGDFDGPQGSEGPQGPQGEQGPAGANGKSAYQYAMEGGYTGTEAEFAAKLAAEIPSVDDTLKEAGKAADAAAVGDALSSLSEEIAGIPSGKAGVGIQSVEQTTTSTEDGGTNVITVTTTDGTSSTFSVRNGSRGSVGPAGADGKDGITPTIGDNGNWYLGDTDTGKPSRGAKGDNGDTAVVDAALDGTSNNPVQNKAIYAALAAKAERVNSADRTVRVEISGTLIYVYFFSGSGYWVRLCFQSRSASGQNYTIMRLNGARASKDRDFGTYITIVPEGYLEYVFAARIGGSNGAWVGGFAHGHENATKTVISLDSVAIESDGTYYGRELRIEQTSEIYNPAGGAKIADHYVLNTITADDGWRVAQTIKWVSAVKLSADTYLCMFALARNAIAKMARNYDYTLYTVPTYGESNATLGAKVDASACVMTGDIDCEVEQLETSGNDCHLLYSDNTYEEHYKVYFRFLTGETEIESGTVFSSKFRVAFNSQLSAVSRNVIHGDEYYTKDETEAKIAELLGVVENGTYSKSEIDTMMGSYISDVAALVGGDA